MDKNSGIEYNREAFVHANQNEAPAAPGTKIVLMVVFVVAAIAILGVIGYWLGQGRSSPSDDTRALVQLDMQIAQLQDRLDQVEQENHRLSTALSLAHSKKADTPAQDSSASSVPPKVYRITSAFPEPRVATPDPATTQKLTALQQGLGAVQSDTNANRAALQATADRLADVAGQVGSQHGEILRNQEDLNRLLAQTERYSVSFELRRGSEPEPVGPVTVVLKSANAKNQQYTVCVYVQYSCVELKNRALYEVVQVALSHTGPPLEFIATKIVKDGVAGYLEVPRDQKP